MRRPTLWDWMRATLLYGYMWLKALPILCIPGFITLFVWDQEKEITEMYDNVATLRRLLKTEQ